MMLEGKPQGNTDLKKTSQGCDILLNKTGIQQDFRKADLDLTTVVVSFPWKYFLAKQDSIRNKLFYLSKTYSKLQKKKNN